MSERIHALASQLFGKPTVAACDLQEIRNLANRYPNFFRAFFLHSMLIEIQVGVESVRVNEIFKLEWIMVIEYCFLELGIVVGRIFFL